MAYGWDNNFGDIIMARKHSPDKWIIVKFSTKEHGDVYKVLGGWSGGYLDSDNWRLSSGLERVEEDGDYLLMHNYSGSIYKCRKGMEGTTGLSGGILHGWLEEVKDNEDVEITTITVEEFNNLEKKCKS